MKMKIVFLLLLATSASQATPCNPMVLKNKRAVTAIHFLNSIKGYYEGDGCKLSIDICSLEETTITDVESTLVGEILVVDKYGREMYLPLDFRADKTSHTKSSISNGKRMFHYEYKDYNRDPEGASYEAYLFEAVKESDLTKLKYVEFGIIEKKDKKLHWSVCDNLQKM
jgi:hypothetical protein